MYSFMVRINLNGIEYNFMDCIEFKVIENMNMNGKHKIGYSYCFVKY